MLQSAWVPLLSRGLCKPPQDWEPPGPIIPCCGVTDQSYTYFFPSKHGSIDVQSAVCFNNKVLKLAHRLLCDTIPGETLTNVYSPEIKD